MHGTPAKAKYFSAPVVNSPEAPHEQRERVAIGVGDGLAQLEKEEIVKHSLQFVRPSLVKPATPVGIEEPEPVSFPLVVERQRLLSTTSKHCGTCDKILVKLNPDPSNSALDVKNRIHVAAIFVVKVTVASLLPKDGKVTLILSNPMKNQVLLELSPLVKGCRFTLAKPQALTLAAAPGRAPVSTRVAGVAMVVTAEANPTEKFGAIVTIRYEGVLGKQETKYNVYLSK